jgi:hypothetical protein
MTVDTQEARNEQARETAMSEDFREELEELDSEDALETDAELDELEEDD